MERFDPASAVDDAISQDSASRCIGQPRHCSTGKRIPTFDTDADDHVDLVEWREDFRNIPRIILAVTVQ